MAHSRLTTFLLACLLLAACGKKVRLTDSNYQWVPYTGHETLVFASTTGEADTIFLTGSTRRMNPADPMGVSPPKLEHYTITARHSDPAPPDGRHRYLEGAFLELSVSAEKIPYLTLHHTAKNAWFYGGHYLPLPQLDSMPRHTLTTKNGTYTDMIWLRPDDNQYAARSNFITQLYWSKSQGLLRYDKQDGVYWELVQKY